MKGRIFLLGDDKLRPMNEQPYDSEDLLQRLLADYPELLAGDQIDEADPRRWLLVNRELGIPDNEGGPSRWAVDHLFLDQDGIPTLIEVKRSSDTRIRREVVGQLLEYAAHAAAHWPVDTIRDALAARYEKPATPIEQVLAEAFGIDADEEAYWQRVETNLSVGRLRLIFVADKIHRELRRVVEFLNKHMSPMEVLAIEIRQFVGEGHSSLVPRVIGLTVEAEDRKTSSSRTWTTEAFLARLERLHSEDARIAEKIVGWGQSKGLSIVGGRGAKHAGVHFVLTVRDVEMKPFNLYEDYHEGYLYLAFGQMGPALSMDERAEFCERVNQIEGLNVLPQKINPGIGFSALRAERALDTLLGALEWMVERIRAVGA